MKLEGTYSYDGNDELVRTLKKNGHDQAETLKIQTL